MNVPCYSALLAKGEGGWAGPARRGMAHAKHYSMSGVVSAAARFVFALLRNSYHLPYVCVICGVHMVLIADLGSELSYHALSLPNGAELLSA